MAHTSVLCQETIAALALRSGMTVLDGTFGGGGHSREIAALIGPTGTLIACDRDEAVFARPHVAEIASATRFLPQVTDFRNAAEIARNLGIPSIDAAVLDLGLSSDQLENSGRGFSFLRDEPLAMTFAADPTQEVVTAASVVNEWSEETLREIIHGFGEERFAGRIARAIVAARNAAPIATSRELAEIVTAAIPAFARHGKTHPATKAFQAIRMAVNDELGAVHEGVPALIGLLAPGGHLAVITFHSGEDRAVKHLFRDAAAAGLSEGKVPPFVAPSAQEVSSNPRARSAKLRTFVRSSLLSSPPSL